MTKATARPPERIQATAFAAPSIGFQDVVSTPSMSNRTARALATSLLSQLRRRLSPVRDGPSQPAAVLPGATAVGSPLPARRAPRVAEQTAATAMRAMEA